MRILRTSVQGQTVVDPMLLEALPGFAEGALAPPAAAGPVAAVAAGPAAGAQPAAVTWEPLSLDGVLFADARQVGRDETVVTNILTYEKHALPGQWELTVDGADGMLFQVSEAGGPDNECIKDVETLFAKTLYTNNGDPDDLWIHESVNGEVVWTSISLAASRQRTAQATMLVGPTEAGHDFDVTVFRRPRPSSQKCFWSLSDLYVCIGSDSFQNASKWVDRGLPRWNGWLKKVLGDGHFIFSTFLHENCHKRRQLPFHERCTAATSVSTAGLISLLCRLAYFTKGRGGLSTVVGRNSCKL